MKVGPGVIVLRIVRQLVPSFVLLASLIQISFVIYDHEYADTIRNAAAAQGWDAVEWRCEGLPAVCIFGVQSRA